ncbi:hypothetical protein [Sphingomonas sp. Leaf257]|uniref:hypothetical protein n=1 Tax=Sphingomonas sp. Leaf257 TaxID=1736309 RepID=UPI0006F8862F|nr:hypothetical protein [Sphingomonas sp. Leaf257]KQO51160.1 hypothetical protein ASF14_09875 [Sphingomonas sp. Leaf257]
MTALAHIVSVVAIWTLMLFGVRFAVSAGHWLVPCGGALWHLARCRGPNKSECRAAFRATIAQLHADLVSAIKTPWSATLLFGGSVLIGLGYFFGSAGDAARLVSAQPDHWIAFDVATDCTASVFATTGMSFVLAAFSRHRTASFLVSGVLILTGLGIGVSTL